MAADWDRNGTADEYFAIGTTRHVVHVWRGAGWKGLSNGYGDDTVAYGFYNPKPPYVHGRYVKVRSGSSCYNTAITSSTSWTKFYKVSC